MGEARMRAVDGGVRAGSMGAALALEDVWYRYGRGGEAILRGISLRVEQGEMVGLLGPNGAGKSTLLKVASGVARAERGRVWVQGEALGGLKREEVARRLAVVPQEFSVQFAYTVRQIVELGRLAHHGGWGTLGTLGGADRAAVTAALAETAMEPLAERVFNELSGGERQRALLALALAQDAPIILLDEPTAHLDVKHQVETLELLRRLNRERGLTVVAALHDLNLAARYFPRLALLRRELVADGSPAQVLDGALLAQVYETGAPLQVGILRGEEYLSVSPPGVVEVGAQPERRGARARAHVLAGGGSGELLMRTLADAQVAFSAGPLNVGDSDYALAQRLAALCIAEPPYAPVSPQGLEAARERMREAGAAVVCPMPLGPGNVTLLEAALAARRAGTLVIALEPGRLEPEDGQDGETFAAVEERDFSGRGVALYRELLAAGAHWAASPGDALALLEAGEAGRELR